MLRWQAIKAKLSRQPDVIAIGRSENYVRLRLLQSKMYEYDGSVRKTDRVSTLRRAFTASFGQCFIRSLWFSVPFYSVWAYCAAASQAHDYGVDSLLHSYFIFQLAVANIGALICNLHLALILTAVKVAPGVYPEAVYVSPQGFAFGDNKRLIPWEKLQLVKTNRYLYRRFRHSNVLELYVEPVHYAEPLSLWEKMQEEWKTGGLKKHLHFLHAESRKPPNNPYTSVCLRLPLELFGFEGDKQRFLKAIKDYAPEGAIQDDLVIGPDTSDGPNYTAVWLEELRSPQTLNNSRLLKAGQSLQNGRYQITDVLGYGGFSVVYKAQPSSEMSSIPGENASVAIKEVVINSGGSRISKEAILRQIIAEIELLKTLDHPHIVKCLDYFIDGGRVYIVMQALGGRNLRDVVTQDGALTEKDLTDIATQCCLILTYLHTLQKPLMHRDFTPDNLIWDGHTVKLIDFNVAEEANTNSSPTIVGKHCFLAPEQWCGTFTPRGDLYQLGCSLYFLATAQEPEPLTQSNPATLRPELTPSICAVIQKLTEQDLENRYDTASDTALALRPLEGAAHEQAV